MEELKCDFIEEDLIEHMNSEELEMVLAYISKWFDTIEDSKVQLNNCMNLIKFINIKSSVRVKNGYIYIHSKMRQDIILMEKLILV